MASSNHEAYKQILMMSGQIESQHTHSFQANHSQTMEIADMAIGIVSLVSVFENAITTFSRLRMAKSFGSDL